MISNKMEPIAGEKYVHFKGEDKKYEIVATAYNCENPNEKIVVYKQLYDTEEFPIGTIWTRSLEDFVGYKEYSDKTRVKRFTKTE